MNRRSILRWLCALPFVPAVLVKAKEAPAWDADVYRLAEYPRTTPRIMLGPTVLQSHLGLERSELIASTEPIPPPENFEPTFQRFGPMYAGHADGSIRMYDKGKWHRFDDDTREWRADEGPTNRELLEQKDVQCYFDREETGASLNAIDRHAERRAFEQTWSMDDPKDWHHGPPLESK